MATDKEAKELNQALATAMLDFERAWEIYIGSVASAGMLPTRLYRVDAALRPRPVSQFAALMVRRNALGSGVAGMVHKTLARPASFDNAASRDMLQQLENLEECVRRVDQFLYSV